MNAERIKELAFHIKVNDYFATLAVILSLVKDNRDQGENDPILTTVIDDLLFLQKHYRIITKH